MQHGFRGNGRLHGKLSVFYSRCVSATHWLVAANSSPPWTDSLVGAAAVTSLIIHESPCEYKLISSLFEITCYIFATGCILFEGEE